MKTQFTLPGSSLAALLLLASGCGEDTKTAGDGAVPGATSDGGSLDTATMGASLTADAATLGDAPPAPAGGMVIAASNGDFVVFDMAPAVNPAKGIVGRAWAWDLGANKTLVRLEVAGLAPSFKYGAHVHKLDCGNMLAGGHYQHVPAGDAGPTHPDFANAMNEVWLDFTTDVMGKAISESLVNFKPRPGEARSVVVHAMMTGAGGVAGTKLACINLAF
jgi:Cu-Zn family superoxide dismutase